MCSELRKRVEYFQCYIFTMSEKERDNTFEYT